MQLATATVGKVNPLLPIIRSRWLATCVRKDHVIDDKMVARARNMSLPGTVPGVGKENSIGAAKVLQEQMHPWELSQCLPTSEAMEAMQDPALLPLSLRKPGYLTMTGEAVLKLRAKTTRQLLPSIMACQGSQHLLPRDLLESKGLHAFLLWDGAQARFAAPFEIAFGMGFPVQLWLPTHFGDAWTLTGNALSIGHAALQCTRTRWIVGEASGLSDCIQGAFDICRKVLGQVCKLDGLVTHVEGSWMVVGPPRVTQVPPAPPTVICDDTDEEDKPSVNPRPMTPEVPDVSPTVQFVAQAPNESTHDDPARGDGIDPVLVPLPLVRPEGLRKWTMATHCPTTGGIKFHDETPKSITPMHALFQCGAFTDDLGQFLRDAMPSRSGGGHSTSVSSCNLRPLCADHREQSCSVVPHNFGRGAGFHIGVSTLQLSQNHFLWVHGLGRCV